MAMRLRDNCTLVLGAGFTKAFFPNAPLLVDDWGLNSLLETYSGLPHIQDVLQMELKRSNNGKANLERLFTRLTAEVPFEGEPRVEYESRVLLSELKGTLRRRLQAIRDGSPFPDSFQRLAHICVKNEIDCITFNYDDVFDQALWEVEEQFQLDDELSYWHPDGGYGFYCPPSRSTVRGASDEVMDEPTNLLLKLHGSLNWRVRRGKSEPISVADIVHHQGWLPDQSPLFGPTPVSNREILRHLEDEPMIVPPVLDKSAFGEEPLLRLVWRRAYEVLSDTDQVVFVGYSLPETDLVSKFLFEEAIPSEAEIRVVNWAEDRSKEKEVRAQYRRSFPDLDYWQFTFDGASQWASTVKVWG